jgi:predicted dehydrogenase
MEKTKIALIGVGNIAQTFHLPILAKMPDAEIVAVCDIDGTKAEIVAKKFNINRWYTDYHKMLETEDELTGVAVCTSTDTHRDISLAVIKAKKELFVEKPLARSADEAEEIEKAAKKANVGLMVGMNNRFRPDAMILKSFIENEELGDIYYVKAGWLKRLESSNPWLTRKERSGGGVLLDLGITMFDMAFWMMGYPEVRQVMASMYSHKTKKVEDSMIAFIMMKNGMTISIESSWSFESKTDFFYCDCFGTGGSGSLNPFQIYKRMHGNLVNVAPANQETPQNLHRKSYQNELKHWISVLRKLHPIISTGEEAVHRMKVVDALYKSAKTGKAVSID